MAMASLGELLTRLTVWVAMTAYTLACAAMVLDRDRGAWSAWIRVAWTAGCVVFLAHVACAFGFYHQWSHDDALRVTARQTAEMTGWQWGGGLYFNYAFAGLWLGDVLWWWLAPESRRRRPRVLGAAIHGFLFFMVVNGACVFARGPLRWYGLLLCALVAALWLRGLSSSLTRRHDTV